MFQPKMLLAAIVWLGASLTAFGQANYVVELSGAANGEFFPYAETSGPLNLVHGAAAGPGGTFEIIPRPDGQEFFLIGNSAPFLQYTGPDFSNPQAINIAAAPGCNGPFPATSCAVALTPNGKYLLVAADKFYAINVATNSVTFSLSLPVSSTPIGIAVTENSDFAYVVTSSGVVQEYNLATEQAVASLGPLTGGATGITLSPQGLLYVPTGNAIYEINSATLTLTANPTTANYANGVISVFFRPGPLRFTYDGTVAYAASTDAAVGGALMKLTVATYTVSTSENIKNPNIYPQFADVYVASSSVVYAISPSTGTVWDVDTTGSTAGCTTQNPQCLVAVQDSTLPSIATQNVISGAISNELPLAQSLFLLSAGTSPTLTQINLPSNTIVSQIAAPLSTGALQFATAPPETGAANFLTSNASQTVQPDAISAPLTARVLTSSGQPIYNEQVTFSTSSGGPAITNSAPTSTLDGYVSTTVTSPLVCGPYTVTLSAGSASVNFSIFVPGNCGSTPTNPTGPSGTSSQVTIVSGDGQYVDSLKSETSPIDPLTVLVTDTNGNPLPNVPVTFSVTAGNGSVDDPTSTTDANGHAFTDFYPQTNSFAGVDFATSTVTATATLPPISGVTQYGSVNFSVTTVNDDFGVFEPYHSLVAPTGSLNINLTEGIPLPGAIQVQWYGDYPVNSVPIPGIGIQTESPLSQTLTPGNAASGYVPPVAACQGSTLSNSTGLSSCTLVTTCAAGPGTYQLLVVGGGGPTFPGITVTILPGPAQISTSNGNNQTGAPGQTLPGLLVATVTDSCNNPLAGQNVNWRVTQGSATLSNTVNTTNKLGQVSTSVILGSTAGAVQVTLTVGSSTGVFNLTSVISVTLGSISATSGNGQTATVGASFAQPVTFTLLDNKGNPVSGVGVTLAVTSGTATLGSTSGSTTAQGQISTTVTAGSTAGAIVITATSGSVSGTATLIAQPPPPTITPASFTNAASGAVGLVPCGLATVTGSGIAPTITGVISAANNIGPLPFTLGGFSMSVNGIPAPIESISNQNGVQAVNFQTPCESGTGPGTVVLQVNGVTTTIPDVQVNQVQPGIFYYLGANGMQYGAVISAANGGYVTSSNYAVPGGTYYLLVTGLGQTNPPLVTDDTGLGQNVTAPVVVGVSNMGVPVTSVQYASDIVGVYVVTFQIPTTTSTGAPWPTGPNQNLAVYITINGQQIFGNGVLLAGIQ